MIDVGLYIGYLLFFVAAGSAVAFPFMYAVKHPDVFKKSLVGIGALVFLFVLSYFLTGSEVTVKQAAQGITEGSSKMIGAGLTMLYLTMGAGLVALIYSEITIATK
jgi:hypothetical protein